MKPAMRLLLAVAGAALVAAEVCKDLEGKVNIPGLGGLTCDQIQPELDCGLVEVKVSCRFTCNSCVGNCQDGTGKINMGDAGEQFCESIDHDFNDCANDDVSAYCPKSCNACEESASGTGGEDVEKWTRDIQEIKTQVESISSLTEDTNNNGRSIQTLTQTVQTLKDRIGVVGEDTDPCRISLQDYVNANPERSLKSFQHTCPNDCDFNDDYLLYGVQPFTSHSSICAAAMVYGITAPAGTTEFPVTVVPQSKFDDWYGGVTRNGVVSLQYPNVSDDLPWIDGFIIPQKCEVLSIAQGGVGIGYFASNFRGGRFQQWVYRSLNEDGSSTTKYFESDTNRFWRLQSQTRSNKIDYTLKAGCAGISSGFNGQCIGLDAVNCGVFRSDEDVETNCDWVQCTAKDQYFDTKTSTCTTLPSDYQGRNQYCAHNDGQPFDSTTWISTEQIAQVPLKIELFKGNNHAATEYQGQCQDSKTLEISCLNGGIMACPNDRVGDHALSIAAGDDFVDYTVPMPTLASTHQITNIVVELDNANKSENRPSDWSNQSPLPGQNVFLYMRGSGTIYKFTYTATDDRGNEVTCNTRIEVRDNEDPVLTCPGNMAQNLEPNANYAFLKYEVPTATDNVSVSKGTYDAKTQTFTASEDGKQVNCYPPPEWKVEDRATDDLKTRGKKSVAVSCVAYDPSGNFAECAFLIEVNDTECPKFQSCPATTRTEIMDLDQPFSTVKWSAPTAIDNTAGEVPVKTFIKEEGETDYKLIAESEHKFYKGQHSIIFEASDARGNTALNNKDANGNKCDCPPVTVNVVDTQPPIFTKCPTTIWKRFALSDGQVVITYEPPECRDNSGEPCTPFFSDNSPKLDCLPGTNCAVRDGQGEWKPVAFGANRDAEQNLKPGAIVNQPETYNVRWSATDSAGHTADCIFKVVAFTGCRTYKIQYDPRDIRDHTRLMEYRLDLSGTSDTSYAEWLLIYGTLGIDSALYLDLQPDTRQDEAQDLFNWWQDRNQLFTLQHKARSHPIWDDSGWRLTVTEKTYKKYVFTSIEGQRFDNLVPIGRHNWVVGESLSTELLPIDVQCASLCNYEIPETPRTGVFQIDDHNLRTIYKRNKVPCRRGWQGKGIDYCCDSSPDSELAFWNLCPNSSIGECTECAVKNCADYELGTCRCLECDDPKQYFLDEYAFDDGRVDEQCSLSCSQEDFFNATGGKRCDNGIPYGSKNDCKCKCGPGWAGEDCSEQYTLCPTEIDARGKDYNGWYVRNLSEDTRQDGEYAGVNCASNFLGGLVFKCVINGRSGEWVYDSGECRTQSECDWVLADVNESCQAACHGRGLTCNANLMNGIRQTEEIKPITEQLDFTSKNVKCSRFEATIEPYAPFYDSAGASETCYYLHDYSEWSFSYDQPHTQCHLGINSGQRERFCACCAGCAFVNNEDLPVIEEHIGQGETWMEILDQAALPKCPVLNSQGAQVYGKNETPLYYNYNPQLSVGADCSASNTRPHMPKLCGDQLGMKHYVLADRRQNCNDACENIVDSTHNHHYECDAYETSGISNYETLRQAAARVGILCNHYPNEYNSLATGGGINPSIFTQGGSINCFARSNNNGSNICGERGQNQLGTGSRQRICVCKRI